MWRRHVPLVFFPATVARACGQRDAITRSHGPREFANLSNAEIAVRCWAWINPFQLFAHHSGNDLV